MEYEKVAQALLEQVPEFHPAKDVIEPPYILAGNFAHFLFEMHRLGNCSVVERGLAFIEHLYQDGGQKISELATIGYLEGIQNVWANHDVDPEAVFGLLGEESRKWWRELNKFWDGKIKHVGETFE